MKNEKNVYAFQAKEPAIKNDPRKKNYTKFKMDTNH